MVKQTIDIGTTANDGTGDALRTAFGKVNDNFDNSYFAVQSTDTLIVPDDTAPTFITNITSMLSSESGFTLDATLGAMQNTSGKTLTMVGNMAIQYQQTGVGDTDFWIYSESSTDGTNWTKNVNSLRYFIIDRDGVDYKTILSYIESDWASGTYVRFMFAKDGNTLELTQASKTIGLDTILSHSFFWTMWRLW